MSECLNRTCPRPQNPDDARFCQTCGQRLQLGDRYRAVQRIGDEASSTLLGMDLQTGETCIIKQYAVGDRLSSFRQEVARLDVLGQHPQIPNLLAYFERESQQYLVQERIEGQTLLDQLHETGTFSEAQLRQVLQEILPLLQFLHDRQVIHRDIKPANLVQRRGDEPLMLVDFGTAKHTTQSALAKPGTVLGSAEYAAPEQLVGKAIAPSDLYSLGVTCIQLLTGLAPFDLYSGNTWIWRSVAPDVSDTLAQVLDKLLQNSASQRYQSAAEVMQALGILPFGRTIVQSSAGPLPLQLWDCTQTIPAATPLNAIAVQSSCLAAGGNDGAIYQWRLPAFEPLPPLKIHRQPITAIAFAHEWLISSSLDGTIYLWDGSTDQPQMLTDEPAPITAIALSPDRRRLLSGGRDGRLKLWDLATRQLLHSFSGQAAIESIAWADTSIASGGADGSIAVWHSETRELLRTWMPHKAAVQAVAIASDQLVSSSWDLTLQMSHLHTGGLRQTLTGHLLPVVALAQQGDLIASGSHDSTIRIWRAGQLQDVLKGHQATVKAIAFSEIGLVSGSQDSTIRIWQSIERL